MVSGCCRDRGALVGGVCDSCGACLGASLGVATGGDGGQAENCSGGQKQSIHALTIFASVDAAAVLRENSQA